MKHNASKIIPAPGSAFVPGAIGIISRMNPDPPPARKILINNFFVSTAGIWEKADAFYFFAAHAQAPGLLNWRKNAHDATIVNGAGMTFTADRGFKGNGVNSFLNLNFNPVTQGVNYLLNTCSMGIYSRTNIDENTRDIGANISATNSAAYLRMCVSGNTYMYTNVNATISTINNGLGLFLVSRYNATQIRYKIKLNATSNGAGSNSTAMPNFNFYCCAANNNGTAGNFTNREYSFAWIGGVLTIAELDTLALAVETYLDAIGAGVIP